jgi:hypothetical protein
LGLVTLAACSTEDEPICTQSEEPALIVYVVDSVDGTPRAAGATGLATDQSYSDPLRPGISDGFTLLALQAALERPGLYQVRVEKPGFQAWEQANVRVVANACHVMTVQLTARLQPAEL